MTDLTRSAPAMVDLTDEIFAHPYIDIDEPRTDPVEHRYVHGGFADTQTRFSLYLPSAERYEGRFFQHITPVPLSEHLAQAATGQEDRITFAHDSGAFFVETNGGADADQGPGAASDPTITAYRANAAVARYARVVAEAVYGPHRVHGYAYGGSGGGYRTIGSAENTTGAWDGFVPYVIGSPVAIPNVFSVRMHAQRVLRDVFDDIVDAVEPGGERDMRDGLTPEQREALDEVTRMGFPPRSWFGWRTMGIHAFSALYPGVAQADPSYFTDFWTEPGYLGADPSSSVHRDSLQFTGEVAGLVTRAEALRAGLIAQPSGNEARAGVDRAFRGSHRDDEVVGVRLSSDTVSSETFAVLETSGSGSVRCAAERVVDGIAILDPTARDDAERIRVGDRCTLDNSDFLAAQTYHRHQDPGAQYPAWQQFRDADGAPILPQRPMLLGPMFTAHASGSLPTGEIAGGRMIVVACLLDREAFAWQADWYRQRVAEHLGDAADERFRLWFIDNALHGDEEEQEHPTHSVSYIGALQHALRAVAAWVERGVEPAETSAYEIVDGQTIVAGDARARRGVQPVVTLTANGSERADVARGETVALCATVAVPPRAGAVTRVEWDLDGSGAFTDIVDVDGRANIVSERRFSWDDGGTRFVTVRVTSQPADAVGTPHTRTFNLARARVVVV